MKEQVHFGIVGAGQIAADLALSLEASTRARIVNVSGSSPEKARAFAARWGVPRAAASVDELCGDPGVDVVYVATPHPAHEAHALAAIAAGKAVLCEKPFTMDAAGAARVVAAARARGVFVMEAFMYRCHPLVRALVDSGVRAVEPKQAWTDVARFAQRGIAAVNFGPGENAQAHQKNESTSLPLLHEGYAITERWLRGIG